jgi:hypothetical protein
MPYRGDYVRDSLSKRLNVYKQAPIYTSKLDDLYQDSGLVYEKRRFKYMTAND